MARPPDGTQARRIFVNMRLAPDGARILDTLRGPTNRGAYLRRLLAEEATRRGVR